MKELELILATVAQLGAEGKEAFIWWLIFDKLIVGLVFLAAVWSVAFTVYRVISVCSAAAKMRDMMGVGSPGAVTDSEMRDMAVWISQNRPKQEQ